MNEILHFLANSVFCQTYDFLVPPSLKWLVGRTIWVDTPSSNGRQSVSGRSCHLSHSARLSPGNRVRPAGIHKDQAAVLTADDRGPGGSVARLTSLQARSYGTNANSLVDVLRSPRFCCLCPNPVTAGRVMTAGEKEHAWLLGDTYLPGKDGLGTFSHGRHESSLGGAGMNHPSVEIKPLECMESSESWNLGTPESPLPWWYS